VESVGCETSVVQRGSAISSFLLDNDAVLHALASRLGGRDAVFESGIRGNSMAPAIPGGARLRVRLRAGQSCHRGDIVFFLSDNGFMVHRIIYQPRRSSPADFLLTLGDNCIVPDPPVRIDRVLGGVIEVQTADGWNSPGALVHRSICHRAARAVASVAMIVALHYRISAARRLEKILRTLEAVVRTRVGRLLRRLHLIPPVR
jgi:hypothetical protein